MDPTATASFKDDYLEQLPTWDGVPRVDKLLQQAFSLHLPTDAERAICEQASRAIMLGAVLRSFEPGERLDQSAVLIGGQGIGKSTFCRHLVPERGRDDWFVDGVEVPFVVPGDGPSVLDGVVVVECLPPIVRSDADMDAIKAYLSRRVDRVRRPYERVQRSYPRTHVNIFTTNSERALLEMTGGRQCGPLWDGLFLPVHIAGRGPRPVAHVLNEIRDQLWAEAVHRFKADERPSSGLAATAA